MSDQVIFRHMLRVADDIELPASVVHVLDVKLARGAYQDGPGPSGVLEAWTISDPSRGGDPVVRLHCRGTGHAMQGNEGRHIATVLDHGLVWHIFEHKEVGR